MFIPITHSIYTITKRVFCNAKVIDSSEVPEGPLRVPFRFHGDRVLFRFLSDRALLRVPSDRTLIESSVIDPSSWSSVIDSSLGPSVLLFWHAAIFYQIVFLLKADVLFYIIFSKRTSH